MTPSTPLDLEYLRPYLTDYYGLIEIDHPRRVEGGYRCKNMAFESSGQRYFLKQYREGMSNTIEQVKHAEQFFAERGIPVILPLLDRFGRSAFICEGMWYSLFPFIQGTLLPARALTPHHVASLGLMHARLHRLGETAPLDLFHSLPFWNRKAFLNDVEEVERLIQPDDLLVQEKKMARENLQLQAEFVRSNKRQPEDFHLPHTCLLHGDFIYTNIFFFEDGSIQHVYDLERAGVGPRAYDLVRSLFISCFDDGWDEKNFEFARIYLKAYQTIYPINKEEFTQGVLMYTTHFMHMSWLETTILLRHSTLHYPLVGPANARLHHFLGNLEEMIDRLFVT